MEKRRKRRRQRRARAARIVIVIPAMVLEGRERGWWGRDGIFVLVCYVFEEDVAFGGRFVVCLGSIGFGEVSEIVFSYSLLE